MSEPTTETGLCSAHRDGEDPTCHICYPVTDTQPTRELSAALDHVLVPRFGSIGEDNGYLRRCIGCGRVSEIVTEGWPPVAHEPDCLVAEALAIEAAVAARAVEPLRAALERYGHHEQGCDWQRYGDYNDPAFVQWVRDWDAAGQPCQCGLRAALSSGAATPAQPAEAPKPDTWKIAAELSQLVRDRLPTHFSGDLIAPSDIEAALSASPAPANGEAE